jgi:hypothetical protein
VYGSGKQKSNKAAEQLEIKYSTEKSKSKIKNSDVTNGVAESPPEWGGNHPEEAED